MNAVLMWDNLVRYSLQIGVLVGLAALVPAALRMRMPAARLVYWHCLLAACLLLPALRPWKQQSVAGTVEISTTVLAVRPPRPPRPGGPPRPRRLFCCSRPERWRAWGGWESASCA